LEENYGKASNDTLQIPEITAQVLNEVWSTLLDELAVRESRQQDWDHTMSHTIQKLQETTNEKIQDLRCKMTCVENMQKAEVEEFNEKLHEVVTTAVNTLLEPKQGSPDIALHIPEITAQVRKEVWNAFVDVQEMTSAKIQDIRQNIRHKMHAMLPMKKCWGNDHDQ